MKSAAERLLASGPLLRLARWLRPSRTLILAYHNIAPDRHEWVGDASLHLSRSRFRAQLDLLVDFEVVPLASVLAPPEDGRLRVAITFDDAYRGALEAGVEELAARALPATIFVAPGYAGGASFWWDALAEGVDAGSAEMLRARALATLGGREASIRRWAAQSGVPLGHPPAWARVAGMEELQAAARVPGITFGSHAWSHCDLTSLTAPELAGELLRPLTWLRERFSNAVAWLAYPYGRSSAVVEQAAIRAGYTGALRVHGGAFSRTATPFAVPRMNIPAGLSRDGLALRLSGVLS